jgi:hypothetical protein
VPIAGSSRRRAFDRSPPRLPLDCFDGLLPCLPKSQRETRVVFLPAVDREPGAPSGLRRRSNDADAGEMLREQLLHTRHLRRGSPAPGHHTPGTRARDGHIAHLFDDGHQRTSDIDRPVTNLIGQVC